MRFKIFDLGTVKLPIKRENIIRYISRYDFVGNPVFVEEDEKDIGYVKDFILEGNWIYAKVVLFELVSSVTEMRATFKDKGTVGCLRVYGTE